MQKGKFTRTDKINGIYIFKNAPLTILSKIDTHYEVDCDEGIMTIPTTLVEITDGTPHVNTESDLKEGISFLRSNGII